ncbi:penicillin-binding protein 2 [Candidatus Kuenenbacteria bacterium]|nr:penicillin-binding protein 2 [Candidatus Kuenenbacteria bacterium]
MLKFHKKSKSTRITFLMVIFFIFAGAIIFHLFVLQILRHDFYVNLSADIHQFYQETYPKRGEILIKRAMTNELYPIATNHDLYLIYAIPRDVENPEETFEKLSSIIEISKEKILSRLSKKNDLYEPIKHYLSEEEMKKIKELNLKGIKFTAETVRFYPHSNLFSHVLGFVGFKKNEQIGQYGIEEYFEKQLRGKNGFLKEVKGVEGSFIATSESIVQKSENGATIVLTLDEAIQFIACQELKNAVEKYKAQGGNVIVMEPRTGKILALCNLPDFDPNKYNKNQNINTFNNSAIFDSYEPGSVFKAITMAIGLETNKVTPETTFVDTGQVKIGGYTIRNYDDKKYGKQTMTGVLEKSINTGVIFVAHKIENKIFKKYVEDFGFGKLTGIDLPGESLGDINSLDKKGKLYIATASFGQGISVTPIQLISAFSAIANQGQLMKPYVVDKIIKNNGEEFETNPQMTQQVISPKTSMLLSGMLISVVKNGCGKRAGVKNYYMAGKTGTAQVPDKGGYSNKTIQTFVGFGPVDDPRFTILVKLDQPQVKDASISAAPIFSKIAEFILNHYQIPPEKQ